MAKRPWSRLSETLPHPREPNRCQLCGEVDVALTVWQECDDADAPEQIYVVLCDLCEQVIEPHPRLYINQPRNKPLPGVMPQCAGCQHRDELTCRHPLLTANGGAGLLIKASQPTLIHFDGIKGGRRHGWTEQRYANPPECSGLNGPGIGPVVGSIAPPTAASPREVNRA